MFLFQYFQNQLDEFLRQDTDDYRGNVRIPLFEALTTSVEHNHIPLRNYTAIISESFNMIFGPAYVLGTTLTMATYYITRDRSILSNLQAELGMVWPENKKECPPWTTLQKLPYLVSDGPRVNAR